MIRRVYTDLRPMTVDYSALQFAPDGSLERSWFRAFDFSMFGGHNSLDMQATGLPVGQYDWIISTHVIEHVADDAKALQECLRLVGEEGVVHVSAPSPTYNYDTVDWGYPDPKKVEHFREYGADMGVSLVTRVKNSRCVAVPMVDSVTSESDLLFFFANDSAVLRRIVAMLHRRRYPCVVIR